MKKALLASIAIVALSIPSFAGVAAKPAKGVVAPPPECFRAGELQLDTFATFNYVHSDYKDSAWGGGIALAYYVTRNFGLDVEGNFAAGDHALYNPNANLLYRFPLQTGGICWAPYALGGGGGVWGDTSAAEGHVGVGLEYRATPKIGLFSDYRHGWGGASINFNTVRFGLRFVF